MAVGHDSPNRDVYFSSKGHDVPGLYSVLFSLGVILKEQLLKLRRLGGLDGHPDVGIRGIEANTGSLGMGISKGRGMAWAKRFQGLSGRVFIMTGDGELQEGQNYEAFQAAVQQRVSNLTIIVDHNKVQSDKPVCEIIDLGDIQRKLESFGWQVERCNGHDFKELERAFTELSTVTDRPKALITDTVKGRGVSFMEHPAALRDGGGFYRWHAGAPDDETFKIAHQQLVGQINARFNSLGLEPLMLEEAEPEVRQGATFSRNTLGEPVSSGGGVKHKTSGSGEYVVEAYGKALVAAAAKRPDLIVLDADLAADCRIRDFERTYPGRFIQNGIAEQDMVSMAGGLARQGLLPVVNTFANFLASRANEQIYNNATENTKIIYL